MHYSFNELSTIFLTGCSASQTTTAKVDANSFNEPFPYAFFDGPNQRRLPATVISFESDTIDMTFRETRYHSPMIAAIRMPDGETRFSFWCGDAALTGRFSDEHIEAAVDALDGATTSFKSFVADTYRLAPLSHREDAQCDFHRVKTKNSVGCRHTKAMFCAIRNLGGIARITEQLKSRLDELLSNHSDTGIATDGHFSRVTERAFHGVNFLLKAERGVGKTRFAQNLAKATSATLVEGACFDGMESRDFLGGYFPDGTGSFVWLDGPVAEAFRAAQDGKVVLLLDELLRSKQLSVLLTALSPTAEDTYRLRTERIISSVGGLGTREVIECPRRNLTIIGTTNVGDEYDVDTLDPAIEERFIPLTVEMSDEQLTAILSDALASANLDTEIATSLVNFHRTMKLLKRQGQLREATSTRSLSRAIEVAGQQKLASSSTRKDVDSIKTELQLQTELWVEFDSEGKPIADQVDLVKKALCKIS